MSKRILVIHYSQTGQLTNIVASVCAGIGPETVQIDHLKIEPVTEFPYPWTRLSFFNLFPESVFGIPLPIRKPEIDSSVKYDLIILAYTVWYMAPSVPINTFLQSEEAEGLFKGSKVLTVIGARNMWVMAQERVKARLKELDSTLVGNISLVDRNPNLVSIVTIIRWMFYGKKNKFWGFPKAGIIEEDIADSTRFGTLIKNHLDSQTLDRLNPELLENGAVHIEPSLLLLEKRASKLFKMYGKFILTKGGYDDPARLGRVSLLSFLIPLGALILSPITTVIMFIVSRLKSKELAAEIDQLKQIEH